MADLDCRDFFLMDDWWNDCQMYCNWHHLHPEMVQFFKGFRKHCKGLGIPVFVCEIGDCDAIMIAHCHYFRNLTPQHWNELRFIGEEVAGRLELKISPDWEQYGVFCFEEYPDDGR